MGQAYTLLKQLGDELVKVFKFVGFGFTSILRLLVKVFSGDAVTLFGYAPYLALPGIVLVPFQVMVPGTVEFIVAPLSALGISIDSINVYHYVSVFYWIALASYNFYEGEALYERTSLTAPSTS